MGVGFVLRRGGRRGKLVILWCALFASSMPAFAGGSASFALDWKKDIAIGGTALGTYAWGHFAGAAAEPDATDRADEFGWFDDGWNCPYDKTLDAAGDVVSLANLAALPFLLDRFDAENASTIAVMYAETALLATGVKDILKAAVRRPRPYLFQDGAPNDAARDEDRFSSFPSGHATISFATAAFSTYVYSRGGSSRESKWLMGASTFAIAGVASALRVGAGVHYPTDVLAGAAIGALIGIAVPWLHEHLPDRVGVRIGADTVMLVYSF